MTYVVSFTDFMPDPRFDNIPWTHLTIGEATAEDGAYLLIDTVTLAPDADPAHPAARSFTTAKATLKSGWYQITFLDDFSGIGPVTPVTAEAIGEASFLPTVLDVGLELLSRTKDSYGNFLGTFTDATLPTDTQVLNIIDRAAPMVGDAIGSDIPTALWDDARKLIAVRAAMMVETSFFSDQVNTGRSVYPQLQAQYEIELARIQKQISAMESGNSETPINAVPSLAPSYKFPPAPINDSLFGRVIK